MRMTFWYNLKQNCICKTVTFSKITGSEFYLNEPKCILLRRLKIKFEEKFAIKVTRNYIKLIILGYKS